MGKSIIEKRIEILREFSGLSPAGQGIVLLGILGMRYRVAFVGGSVFVGVFLALFIYELAVNGPELEVLGVSALWIVTLYAVLAGKYAR